MREAGGKILLKRRLNFRCGRVLTGPADQRELIKREVK